MWIRWLIVAMVVIGWEIGGLPTAQAAPPESPAKPAKKKRKERVPAPFVPPSLPGGKAVVTDTSDDFIKDDGTLPEGVTVAKTAPTIDFAFYPGQTYATKIWSNWGDSTFANGKYYASFGDHDVPQGNAFVVEYDPATKALREVLDLKKLLHMPEGHYSPGKIHSRTDMGSDGWLYCATHRGSSSVTNDTYFYKGDWIVRCNPTTGEREVVVQAPVAKHCIPNSVLDPQRLIFYGGTAAGDKGESESASENIKFFAYDVKNRKLLYSGNDGPGRYMVLAQSTGKVYYTPGMSISPLMCYDPSSGQPPYEIPGVEIGIRAATRETADGMVYTASKERPSMMYAFNTKTEKAKLLGPTGIGSAEYVAACVADPSGRYVYYTVGAHGGGERTGSPVVQFDTKTSQRKVIAFLTPFYFEKYHLTPRGSYSIAIDDKGETVYVTWNVKRGTAAKPAWDSVGLTAIHVPASERQP